MTFKDLVMAHVDFRDQETLTQTLEDLFELSMQNIPYMTETGIEKYNVNSQPADTRMYISGMAETINLLMQRTAVLAKVIEGMNAQLERTSPINLPNLFEDDHVLSEMIRAIETSKMNGTTKLNIIQTILVFARIRKDTGYDGAIESFKEFNLEDIKTYFKKLKEDRFNYLDESLKLKQKLEKTGTFDFNAQ